MTIQAAFSQKLRRNSGRFVLLPFAVFIAPLLAAGCFVAYVLWPTWPSAPVALDAPALPVTIAGVLFEVPPAAIRSALQRHAGPHERIDLAFVWPSLMPPEPSSEADDVPLGDIGDGSAAGPSPKTEAADAHGRLFVTLTALGSLLPPDERLRGVYPRYLGAQNSADANGLVIRPFRTGTPYEGEDLVYFAQNANRFYASCTRRSEFMPGTCIQERALGAADITLRFPRDWLGDWQTVASGFDRLIAQLHPQ